MGTDITQTQHGGTVTDDAYQVTAVRVTPGYRGIIGNLHAGHSHTGRISQSQVINGETGFARQHLQLARAGLLVILQSSFS